MSISNVMHLLAFDFICFNDMIHFVWFNDIINLSQGANFI